MSERSTQEQTIETPNKRRRKRQVKAIVLETEREKEIVRKVFREARRRTSPIQHPARETRETDDNL